MYRYEDVSSKDDRLWHVTIFRVQPEWNRSKEKWSFPQTKQNILRLLNWERWRGIWLYHHCSDLSQQEHHFVILISVSPIFSLSSILRLSTVIWEYEGFVSEYSRFHFYASAEMFSSEIWNGKIFQARIQIRCIKYRIW